MLIVSRSKVLLVQPPATFEVVSAVDVLVTASRVTASITFKFGSSRIIFSLAPPPSCKKPSPLVGIGVFVQLQVFQFNCTCIALSIFPHPDAKISCPDKTKNSPGCTIVLGGIVTAY